VELVDGRDVELEDVVSDDPVGSLESEDALDDVVRVGAVANTLTRLHVLDPEAMDAGQGIEESVGFEIEDQVHDGLLCVSG
jgi:hypothetical protein